MPVNFKSGKSLSETRIFCGNHSCCLMKLVPWNTEELTTLMVATWNVHCKHKAWHYAHDAVTSWAVQTWLKTIGISNCKPHRVTTYVCHKELVNRFVHQWHYMKSAMKRDISNLVLK